MQQDEWVVCRVFQKSAGAKKYPSNHSRAVNPYTLEIGPSVMSSQMIPPDHGFHFAMGAAGRNAAAAYITPAEMQEFNRVFRGGGGATSSAINFPIHQPHQMNYPMGPAGGGAGAGGTGCFTISGLNLNLGGSGGGSASSQPILRPMPPPPTPPTAMTQQDVLTNCAITSEAAGYVAADMSNPANRFMAMDQCADLDNYWPTYWSHDQREKI